MALADEFFTTWDMRTHVLMTYYAVRARASQTTCFLSTQNLVQDRRLILWTVENSFLTSKSSAILNNP